MLSKTGAWLAVLVIFSSFLDQVELRNIGNVPTSGKASQCGYQVSVYVYVVHMQMLYIYIYNIYLYIYINFVIKQLKVPAKQASNVVHRYIFICFYVYVIVSTCKLICVFYM